MTYEVINVDAWARKEQFEFFRTYDEPFTGVVVEVNVTKCYSSAKENKQSFFQRYLHASLKAAIAIPAFRLRIVDEEVRRYKLLHGSVVILRPDRSFGFSHISYDDDFLIFSKNFQAEKERVLSTHVLFPPINLPNEVHCSSMPWIKFTGLSHARKYGTGDSSPKISFGKVVEREGQRWMPVSIHVHHALADGLDLGEFVVQYQEELDAY